MSSSSASDAKSSYHIGVLDKAFSILLSVADQPKTAVELAEGLGLNWNTVYRIARNLEDKGVLTQIDGKRFAINLQVFQLGAQLRESALVDAARPILVSLAAETRESAFLSIRQGLRATVLHRVESPHPLRLSSRVGSSRPLHAGAMGKLLLSYAPEEVLEQFLRTPLERMTGNTATDPEELRRQLAQIRADGLARTVSEHTDGSSAVAAPVHGASGKVVATLSIGGPSERIATLDPDALARSVCDHADQLSATLASSDLL
ncbi:IclR family transcriptional regulator [Streptomyces antimycoticus]|uniref:IclR family transcriptional regulator n=1 Tax=Streptomyces antimycoticus TaxID=68175 RepID=UPI0036BD29D2